MRSTGAYEAYQVEQRPRKVCARTAEDIRELGQEGLGDVADNGGGHSQHGETG